MTSMRLIEAIANAAVGEDEEETRLRSFNEIVIKTSKGEILKVNGIRWDEDAEELQILAAPL